MIYNNSLDNEQEDELNDNFDFLQIFKALKRNKNILFKAAIISIFFGLIYGFSQKKIWQGEANFKNGSSSSPLRGNRLEGNSGSSTFLDYNNDSRINWIGDIENKIRNLWHLTHYF